MPEEITEGIHIPATHEVLIAGSDSVDIEGVEPKLMTFAVQLGYLHFLLFGLPLVITSGRDGEHVPTSLHKIGRALDFRTHDKSEAEMQVFLGILAYAAPHQNCRVFDERVGAGGEHVHVEYHGQ
jgi:hypothetical protein